MKLIMLSTSAIHHPGPRARWIPLAGIAQRHGIPTEVICLHPDYAHSESTTVIQHGISIHHVAQMHVDKHEQPLHGMTLITTALRAIIRLARHAIQAQPSVIAICKAQPMNGLAALIAQRRTAARLILDVDDIEHLSHRFDRSWQRALVARVEQRLPHYVQSVSAATAWHTQQLNQAGHRHVAHIPNGIEQIPPVPLRPADLPTQYMAYVGRIAFTTHAVDVLIEALTHTRSTMPFVIAGSGPDSEMARQQLHQKNLMSRCIWLGHVPSTTAHAVIAHAHATVDPVRDTPAAAARYPLKIVESLAYGVPVITSPVGDRATLIGVNGRLVPAGSARALADAIDALSEQPRINRTFGHAQVAHLTWESIGLQWLNHHHMKVRT